MKRYLIKCETFNFQTFNPCKNVHVVDIISNYLEDIEKGHLPNFLFEGHSNCPPCTEFCRETLIIKSGIKIV